MRTQTRARGSHPLDWRRWRSAMPVLMLLAIGLGVAAPTALAAGAAGQASIGAADRALAARVQDRFTVLPVQNGIVLTPKRPRGDIRSIELSGGTVAVNGAVVTGSEVRERLGNDADLVLALSYLDPATRARLFGFEASTSTPSPESSEPSTAPPPAAAPVVPEPPSTTPEPPEPPEAPEPPTRSHRGDQVRFGGSITVPRGEVVDGDVVAIGGSVRVDGEVHGDVAAIGGSAHLGPDAIVDGDVTVLGGRIDRDPNATVHGGINTIGVGGPFFGNRHFDHDWFRYGPFFSFLPFVGFLSSITRTGLLMLLVCLVLLVAERPVDSVARRAKAEPVKAGLIGLACELLFLPVLILTIVLLIVTIIGIPLLILVPFALIALLIVFLLGFTATAREVGRWVDARLGLNLQGPFLPAIIGVFAICVLTIVGRLAGGVGSFFELFAVIFLAIGAFIEWAAWTVGFGAAVLARFGARLGPSSGPATVTAPAQTGEAGA